MLSENSRILFGRWVVSGQERGIYCLFERAFKRLGYQHKFRPRHKLRACRYLGELLDCKSKLGQWHEMGPDRE